MALLKLILREDVEKLGHAGDVVSVKPGYGRNYLLPQGKASLATASRVRELEHTQRMISEEQAKQLKDLDAVKTKIESLSLEVSAQAGVEGKLFGSVTTQQIAELLAEKGVDVDRRKLQTDAPIKTLGEHSVSLRLHRELVAKVKVVVSSETTAQTPGEKEDPPLEAPSADDSE